MGGLSGRDPAQTAVPTRRLPPSGRVLVVEDESSLRDTLEILVTMEGCDVRTAADGESALTTLMHDGWVPDLILLDLTLPGMSGPDFISAYRATPEAHAAIIVMTGRTIDTPQVIAMGATGYLPKPFDVNDLLDVMATFADHEATAPATG